MNHPMCTRYFRCFEYFRTLYFLFVAVYFLNIIEKTYKFGGILCVFASILILRLYEYLCSKDIKLITLNVNDDRRFEGPISEIFPELKKTTRAKNYKKFIQNTIRDNGTNCIFNFSEILSSGMLKYLESIFYMAGYQTSVKKYCLDDKSFYYMLAWDSVEYDVNFCEQIYFTKSGNPVSPNAKKFMKTEEIRHECMDVEFERSMPVYFIEQKFGNRKFYLGQIDCGLTNKHKKQVCAKINDFAQNIYKEVPFIVAGNWNCFDSDLKIPMYYDKMFHEFMEDHNFNYISTVDLVEQGVTSTFRSYDFDVFRYMTQKEKKFFNDQLYQYGLTEDKETMKNKIREYLYQFIDNLQKSKYNGIVGVNKIFEHDYPDHISESLIIDMIIGWNLKNVKIFTEKIDLDENMLSDHSPLLSTIS